jgi:glycerol uptake facilitator-like aquaporin
MKKYIAEIIGTFALIFCCTGAVIANQEFPGQIGLVGISIISGLIVSAMIYALGDVSGAHINPAVSFAFYIAGEFSFKDLSCLCNCSGHWCILRRVLYCIISSL